MYGQTTSRHLADRKTAKFQKNITRRGSVPETTVKKGNDYPVGPVVLGFFIFVVIGSCMPSDLLSKYLFLINCSVLVAFEMITYGSTIILASNFHDQELLCLSVLCVNILKIFLEVLIKFLSVVRMHNVICFLTSTLKQ